MNLRRNTLYFVVGLADLITEAGNLLSELGRDLQGFALKRVG